MKQIVLVIAVALLLTACSKGQPKKVEIRPVRVTLVQHALSDDTISLTGQIQAKDPISLAFRIGGRLQERSVTVGDPVAPGQVVARIEPQDFQNALRSAEADLASAQAVLANSKGTEGRQSELRSSTPFSTASVKLGSGGTSTLLLLCSNERTLRCGNTNFGRCHKETLGTAGGRAAHPTRSFAHLVGEEGLIGE